MMPASRLSTGISSAHDAPTDVLSFPADEPDPETGRRYLGDVAISLARAAEQAARTRPCPGERNAAPGGAWRLASARA